MIRRSRISSSRLSVAFVPFVAIIGPGEKTRGKGLADCRKAKRGLIIAWISLVCQATLEGVGSTTPAGMLLF